MNVSARGTASIACRAGEFLYGQVTLIKENIQTCGEYKFEGLVPKTEEKHYKTVYDIVYQPDALSCSAELSKM